MNNIFENTINFIINLITEIMKTNIKEAIIVALILVAFVVGSYLIIKCSNHLQRDRYDIPADTLKVEDNHLVNNK